MDAKMDCEILDSDDDKISLELIAAAQRAADEVLPATSKKTYMNTYKEFEKWRSIKKVKCINEQVMMAYFFELSEKNKPSSLWAYYSMLKATLRAKNNVDMANFHQLVGFLKSKMSGYQPVKAKVFSEVEIKRFLVDAPDGKFLDVKVACIFAVSGALRTDELVNITVQDIEEHGDSLLLVRIRKSKNKSLRSFTISGEFYTIVKKYSNLRVPGTINSRFFVNFRDGKCTAQVIGKNKLSGYARKIATFLQLDGIEGYTGHSFRRSSTTILANTGASIETIKRHGSWKSSKVAEGYIEDSIHYKKRTGDMITSTITSAFVGQSEDALVDPLADPLADPLILPHLETVTQLESRNDVQGASKVDVQNISTQSSAMAHEGTTDDPLFKGTMSQSNTTVRGSVCGALKSFKFSDMKSCTFNIHVSK